MSNPLYAFPTTCEQTLRALARYPSRTAFAWPGGSITYQGATDLIGRIQNVFMRLGLKPGARVAFLTANRADTWCAGVAAQLAQLAVTCCILWARWRISYSSWRIPRRRCWW
jgi:fatty-acyl-CoA synthase